jgi:hypothetical protein
MPSCPNLITRSSLVLAMLLSLVVQVLAEEESPTTPEAVWADFEPSKEPLEIEVMKRWAERGSIFTEFTFTGMTHDGSKKSPSTGSSVGCQLVENEIELAVSPNPFRDQARSVRWS